MDFFEMDELFRSYKPPALYIIATVNSKKDTANPIHDEVIGRVAYPLYLQKGERGYICFMEDDEKFHRLHTSMIEDFTSWGNGEETVTIETMNTKYVLIKI